MKVLFVHPSPLMYPELYLRPKPLGVEREQEVDYAMKQPETRGIPRPERELLYIHLSSITRKEKIKASTG